MFPYWVTHQWLIVISCFSYAFWISSPIQHARQFQWKVCSMMCLWLGSEWKLLSDDYEAYDTFDNNGFLCRDARLNAKINSAAGTVVMGTVFQTAYEQNLENAKQLSERTFMLANAVGATTRAWSSRYRDMGFMYTRIFTVLRCSWPYV